MSAMSGINYNGAFIKDINNKMVSTNAAIVKYKQKIQQQQDVEANTALLLLSEAYLRLQLATKTFRRNYYDLLFQMIQKPEVRLSLSAGLAQIESLFAEFKQTNKADIKLVDIERVSSASKNHIANIDKQFQESSRQEHDQQIADTQKQMVDQIMQSRRNRMASIYQRRRIVL